MSREKFTLKFTLQCPFFSDAEETGGHHGFIYFKPFKQHSYVIYITEQINSHKEGLVNFVVS